MTADDTFCAYYEVGHGCCLHRDRDCCGRDESCRDLDCRDAVLGLGVDGGSDAAAAGPPAQWSSRMSGEWAAEDIARRTLAAFTQLDPRETEFVKGRLEGLSKAASAARAGISVGHAWKFAKGLSDRHPEFAFLC